MSDRVNIPTYNGLSRQLELRTSPWALSHATRRAGFVAFVNLEHEWGMNMLRTLCVCVLVLLSQVAAHGANAAPAAQDAKPHADPDKTIDLMPAFSSARDVVSGVWVYKNKILQGKWAAVSKTHRIPPTANPCLQLFAEVPDEYDYSVTFMGTGNGSVTQCLTRSGKAFQFVMNPSGETGCSLNRIVDRQIRKAMPLITPNVKHIALIQVRNTGIKAFYDGQLVLEVVTDRKTNGLKEGSKYLDMLNDDSCLGIASGMSELLILEMTLKNVAKP